YLSREKYLFVLVLDADENGERYEEKLFAVAEKAKKLLEKRKELIENLPKLYSELLTAGIAFKRSELYEKTEVKKLLEKFLDNPLLELQPTFNWEEGFKYTTAEKITGLDSIDSKVLLETLSKYGILTRKAFDSALACPNCGSFKIRVRYRCPYCSSFSIQKSNFIECFLCGTIDSEEYFSGVYYGEPDKYYCPKCERELKGLGLDHRKILAQNRCENCKKIFTEVNVAVHCTECNHTVKLAFAKLVEAPIYTLNPEYTKEVKKQVTSINMRHAISNLFMNKGWKVEAPGTITGIDKINYEFDVVVSMPDNVSKELFRNILPGGKIAIDIIEGVVEISKEKIMELVGKNTSIAPVQYIIVAIPKLSDEAKQLLKKHEIMCCEKNRESIEVPPLIESLASIDFSELIAET
ncbi:MAG: hypothetical protein QXV37_03075, partial [Candidatus Jordarchaeaceae archaeon]